VTVGNFPVDQTVASKNDALAVNGSNVKLCAKTASRRWIALLGVIICLVALIALIVQMALTSAGEIWVLGIMMGLAFLIEAVYRQRTGRVIKKQVRRPPTS
jgi:uncharacterized membrane protein